MKDYRTMARQNLASLTYVFSKEGKYICVHFSCLRAEDVEIIVN